MVDFRKLLPPSTRMEMMAERTEMQRIARLPDAWLAREILKMARHVRALRADTDPMRSYTSALTFRVMPFLAARLDPTVKLLPEEKPSMDEALDPVTFMPAMTPERLREMVLSVTSNADITYGIEQRDPRRRDMSIRLLERHAQHGNPVIVAIDRLHPELVTDPPEIEDTRAPLGGFQVVATTSWGYQKVVTWHPEMEDARQVMADLRQGRLPDRRSIYLTGDPEMVFTFTLRNEQDEMLDELRDATVTCDGRVRLPGNEDEAQPGMG